MAGLDEAISKLTRVPDEIRKSHQTLHLPSLVPLERPTLSSHLYALSGASPHFLRFTIIAAVALINAFCLIGGLTRPLMRGRQLPQLVIQMILCTSIVLINFPVYDRLFFRNDSGRVPCSVTLTSLIFLLVACKKDQDELAI
ncbi:hypothetical protein MLD38_036721 [Melastoma candidum]|uniref:Uncharacterized protein n=1 Tax=Melastoma candidum TaxID=119954 RepID=A0ACB9LLJ5_9MYRT|nr:hypothetical protein MLD38_036721 [Melastoma candidum]